MLKKSIFAVIAVVVLWQVLDFLIHGVILMNYYANQPELWRPVDEMKNGLMLIVSIIAAAVFVGLYAWFVNPKSVKRGILFGLVFGIGGGISMGYGTYSVQPIPYALAFGWFWGTVIETTLAGLITGLIVKQPPTEPAA